MRRYRSSIIEQECSLRYFKKHSILTVANTFLQSLEAHDFLSCGKEEKTVPFVHRVSKLESDRVRNKKVLEELKRQCLLQKSIKAAQEEIRILKGELRSFDLEEKLKKYDTSLTAKKHMSSGELILEGSPQYLKYCTEHSCNEGQLDEGRCQGSAIVSLTSHVCTDPVSDIEDKTCCTFFVKHSFSADSENYLPASSLVCIKCFGESLRLFAVNNVRKGDIVHVLGTLLHPNKEGQCVIGVNALGGNLSIVLPSN